MSIGVPVGTNARGRIIAHVLVEPFDISLNKLNPLLQAGEHARVAGRGAADGFGTYTGQCGILLDAADDVMRVHARDCAKRHGPTQAISVPNATLNGTPIGSLNHGMASDFRNALLWHMDKHDTKIAELVKATGISRDVINKLRSRENSSTTAENALLISAYYGKSLEQFIRCEDLSNESVLAALADLLRPEEAAMLEAQMRGILAARGLR